MEFLGLFENPLPKIKTDIQSLNINISGFCEGFIIIKNIGNGVLKGEITSNTECIVFDKTEFQGNDIKVRYEVNSSMYKVGDKILSNIIISSTGGEVNIPVTINVNKDLFKLNDKTEICSINDFYNFAQKEPLEARRIVSSNDFIVWLKINGFQHIDILEEIINDSNKERALDNFFVLSGVKKKAEIITEKNCIEFKIKNDNEKIINGVIKIKKIGSGYINAVINKKGDCQWLNIFKDKITSKDFDENLTTEIHFEIDKSKIYNNFDCESIIIETDKKTEVLIRVIKESQIKIKIDRQCYSFSDNGMIKIENQSGQDLVFLVKSSDNFIRFDYDRYLIGENGNIPFQIKVATFTKNRMDFMKIPYIEGNIEIKTEIDGKAFQSQKQIIVGYEFI